MKAILTITLLIVLVICARSAYIWLIKQTPSRRWRAAAICLGVILLALVVSGRAHWLYAVIGGILPFLQKLAGLIRYIPLVNFLRQNFNRQQNSYQNQQSNPDKDSSDMTREQAAEILGISIDASKDKILAAHKRLIQKNHPDTGGTDYFAKKINKARDVLLNKRK
jgi:glucan phosphoethanolaminetransferase (alkaline phosphatase superfamily)